MWLLAAAKLLPAVRNRGWAGPSAEQDGSMRRALVIRQLGVSAPRRVSTRPSALRALTTLISRFLSERCSGPTNASASSSGQNFLTSSIIRSSVLQTGHLDRVLLV